MRELNPSLLEQLSHASGYRTDLSFRYSNQESPAVIDPSDRSVKNIIK